MINVLVALPVWFSLRFGVGEPVSTILAGPLEILATTDLMALVISFTICGQEITGSVLRYAFWLSEMVLASV
ncbi:MAG: hypothetical protein GYB53_12345 [Rhodobacteraceae bacterium]|nr:hypothetical protein [Paracoccaceae bacterium]MBR9821468.1 hypothetical protein [Paracoccaceae bacterium]